MIYESYSPAETYELGRKLAQQAKAGDIIGLVGDLGVGKTLFSKGFGKGLGIVEDIISPTFVIVNQYSIRDWEFYHFDVYRIGSIEELEDIGYQEYFYGKGISLVEWADLISEVMPPQTIWVTISKQLEKGLDYRQIKITGLSKG